MHIAVGIQERGEGAAAQVVKLPAEVGEVIVQGYVVLEASDFGKLHGLVETHFCLRSPGLQSGVPGAAIRAVEAAAERMRVGERCIDDAMIGNAEHQLTHADAG